MKLLPIANLEITQLSGGYGRLVTLSAARRLDPKSVPQGRLEIENLIQSTPIGHWYITELQDADSRRLHIDVANNLHVVHDPHLLEEHIMTAHETLRELAPRELFNNIDSFEFIDTLYHALEQKVDEETTVHGHDLALLLSLNETDVIDGLKEYAFSGHQLTLLEERLLEEQDLIKPALDELNERSEVDLAVLLDSRFAIGQAEKHLAEMQALVGS